MKIAPHTSLITREEINTELEPTDCFSSSISSATSSPCHQGGASHPWFCAHAQRSAADMLSAPFPFCPGCDRRSKMLSTLPEPNQWVDRLHPFPRDDITPPTSHRHTFFFFWSQRWRRKGYFPLREARVALQTKQKRFSPRRRGSSHINRQSPNTV